MTVADQVGALLAELGVGHAFGVVGSGNFHVTNALRAAGVPYAAARHEGGAATMADAYARTSGEVAVVTLHQGCGLTNALTGIAEAAKSRTPLLVLAAETAGAAVRSNFRIDQDAVARSVGAVAERVHSAGVGGRRRRPRLRHLPRPAPHRRAQPAPRRAGRARVTRRPPRRGSTVARAPPRPGRGGRAGRAARRRAAPGVHRRPRRPARPRGARGARRRAAARCSRRPRWRTGSSPAARGRSASPAASPPPLAAELITGADLVVAWGASLTMWTTRHGALLGDATLVQVDDTADALGAQRPVDLGVLGDVAATARDVRRARRDLRGLPDRRRRRRAWPPTAGTRRPRTSRGRTASTRGPSRPRSTSCCPPSGPSPWTPATSWATRRATSPCPTRPASASPRPSSRSGWASPPAIGAALARPDRLAVAACGDGGFLMGIAELETAVRLGLGMVVVVYDDAGYGAEFHHFADADHATVPLPRHRPRRDRPRLRVRRGRGPVDRGPRDRGGVARRPARPPAAARREGDLRRPVLVAGRGVPGALREQVSGTRRSRRRAGRSH